MVYVPKNKIQILNNIKKSRKQCFKVIKEHTKAGTGRNEVQNKEINQMLQLFNGLEFLIKFSRPGR